MQTRAIASVLNAGVKGTIRAGVMRCDCSRKPRPPSSHNGEFYSGDKMKHRWKLYDWGTKTMEQSEGEGAHLSCVGRGQGRLKRAVLRRNAILNAEHVAQERAKFNLQKSRRNNQRRYLMRVTRLLAGQERTLSAAAISGVRAAKILAAAPRPAEMSSTVKNCGA
jgi:hypothetical protein